MNKKFRILVIVILLLAVAGLVKVMIDRKNQTAPQENAVQSTVEEPGSEQTEETEPEETEEETQTVSEMEEEERPEAIEVEEDGEVEIIVPEGQEAGGF